MHLLARFLLILALSLVAAFRPAISQVAESAPNWRVTGARADAVFASGDLPGAVRIGRDLVSQAKLEGYLAAYQVASVLNEWCLQGGDSECAVEFGNESFKALEAAPEEIRRSELWRRDYFAVVARSLRLAKGLKNTKVIELWEKPLEQFVLSNPSYGELLFVDANLALAELFLERKAFKRAEFFVERGWASLLTGQFVAPASLLAVIPRFYTIFKGLGQGQRAANVALVASPLLYKAAGTNAYGALASAIMTRSANAQVGNLQVAVGIGLDARREVERIAIPEHMREWLREYIDTSLVFDCMRVKLEQCSIVDEISKRQTNEIVRRWKEGDDARSEVSAQALSAALVNLVSGRDLPIEVREALTHPSLGEDAIDPNGAKVVKAAGRFLRSVAEKEFEAAARHGAEAARALLHGSRESIARQPLDIAPIEGEQALVLSLVVAASLNKLTAEGLSDDELLQISDLLRKSGRNLDGQYMQVLASAPSQPAAASLQTMHRLQQDMHLFERRLLAERVQLALGPSIPENAQKWDHPTLRRIGLNFERFAELRHGTQELLSSYRAPSLQALQAALGDGERFLTHFVTGEQLATLCVSKSRVWKSLTSFDVPKAITDIKLLRAALSNPSPPSREIDSTFPVRRAAFLTEVLLSPVSECFREATHISVAFDQGLSGVPPYVLLDPLSNTAIVDNFPGKAPWLGFRYSISVVSGVGQLIAARNIAHSTVSERKFLGVGDPLLEGTTADGVSRGQAVMRGASGTISRSIAALGELPDTAEELTALATAFGPGSRLLLRDQASEREVRRLHLKEYSTLSFATHGLIREEIPGLTEPALVLTPMVASMESDDGLLTATEISRLELAADLVILSACNSAQFDLAMFGPEAASLSTAFFLAGARSTLASLWSVNSEATARLMAEFGRAYAGGEVGASEAMRIAVQRFVRFSGLPAGFDHPRYWAAFLIHGDGAVRVSSRAVLPATRVRVLDTIGGEDGHLTAVASNGKEAYVTGARPQPGRDVSEGFVRRLAADGRVLWERTSSDDFFSVVSQSSGNGVYLIRHSNPAVLEKRLQVSRLDWTGNESKTVTIALGPQMTLAGAAVEVGTGRIAIPLFEHEAERSKKPSNSVRVVDIDAGKVLHQWVAPTPIEHSQGIRLIATEQSTYLVAITERVFLSSTEHKPPQISPWGLVNACSVRVGTRLFSMDIARPDPISTWSYSDLSVVDALSLGDGSLAVAFEVFNSCDVEPLKVMVGVWRDGKTDNAKPMTVGGFRFGAHALRRIGQDILLLGSVRREFDNAVLPLASAKSDSNNVHFENYSPWGRVRNDQQNGAVVIRLNESLSPVSVDMVLTGMDNYAEDAAVLGKDIVVVGSTSDRQFAFRLPLER